MFLLTRVLVLSPVHTERVDAITFGVLASNLCIVIKLSITSLTVTSLSTDVVWWWSPIATWTFWPFIVIGSRVGSPLITGSSAGISFTHGPIFEFFAPQGRHAAPIKVKFSTEERTAPPCQISPWSVKGWGFTAPKLKKIGILPI